MALVSVDAIRLGPTKIGTTIADVGQIALTTITAGLSNGHAAFVDFIVFAVADDTLNKTYSWMQTITIGVTLESGPTYVLGDTSEALINSSDYFGIGAEPARLITPTIDQSSGNLRLRATSYYNTGGDADGSTIYAIANIIRTPLL